MTVSIVTWKVRFFYLHLVLVHLKFDHASSVEKQFFVCFAFFDFLPLQFLYVYPHFQTLFFSVCQIRFKPFTYGQIGAWKSVRFSFSEMSRTKMMRIAISLPSWVDLYFKVYLRIFVLPSSGTLKHRNLLKHLIQCKTEQRLRKYLAAVSHFF